MNNPQQPYTGFDRLPIVGQWRMGTSKVLQDRNPYTGDLILEIPQASRGELDDAFGAAAQAQTPGRPDCQDARRRDAPRGGNHGVAARRGDFLADP